MPLAIVATAAALPDQRPAPGSLDGDLVRERLPQQDTGFTLVDVDPSVDLAEQLEKLFEKSPPPAGEPILFYASASAVLSSDGELFLCFDPASPDTGDSLRDIAAVFAERARGPVAFLLECRHVPAPEDPFLTSTVVSGAREAVASDRTGIELLVAARPFDAQTEEQPSPFTRALVGALDDVEPGQGLSAGGLYAMIREGLVGLVPCLAYARGKVRFPLLPGEEGAAPVASAMAAFEGRAAQAAERQEADENEPPTVRMPEGELDAAAPDAAWRGPEVAHGARDEVHVTVEAPSLPPVALERRRAPPSEREERVYVNLRPSPVPVVSVDLPRVILSPPAPAAEPRPEPVAPAARPKSTPPPPVSADDHLAAGDTARAAGDFEGALAAYRKALAMLGGAASAERADIYVRQADVKRQQGKGREAISGLEKALGLVPQYRPALEELLVLNLAEGDVRAVQHTEERLLELTSAEERHARLLDFARRWEIGEPGVGRELSRAQVLLERARGLEPANVAVLERLASVLDETGAASDAVVLRLRIAGLTSVPRERAERYFELGTRLLPTEEEKALELFDKALDADPTMLEPLEVVAALLAERQEWSELEWAYRRMLDRVSRVPAAAVRTEVTWELCRRLGLLFRDHLDDPALALDAFEDSLTEKPDDLGGRIVAAGLALTLGRLDRVAIHLQAAALLDPVRLQTFHDLFIVFQRLRRPDLAYAAACVTMHVRQAEPRERFFFEEHRPDAVPTLAKGIGEGGWELLRWHQRDRHLDAVLAAISPWAIAARVAALGAEGRLPSFDPAARQDLEKSTVSVVRSLAWGSHFLDVEAPAVYLREDSPVTLAAVVADEPTVVAGAGALRGKSRSELAFLVGHHLAYHAGDHRLLLYFPSIEELSSCFLAAVAIGLPEIPIPAQMQRAALALKGQVEPMLGPAGHRALVEAVTAFERAGKLANLGAWVTGVERCAARAGYLLCGDLEVAARVMAAEPRGLSSVEDKVGDLYGFAVSDEHAALREQFGIAVQP